MKLNKDEHIYPSKYKIYSFKVVHPIQFIPRHWLLPCSHVLYRQIKVFAAANVVRDIGIYEMRYYGEKR